jgi:hypothetical protein
MYQCPWVRLSRCAPMSWKRWHHPLAAGHGHYLSTVVVLQFVFTKQSSSSIWHCKMYICGKTTTLATHYWHDTTEGSLSVVQFIRRSSCSGSLPWILRLFITHLNLISQYGKICALTYSKFPIRSILYSSTDFARWIAGGIFIFPSR